MLKGKAVLVVEDNVFLALDLASVIEDLEGRVVGPVATAAEALNLLRTEEVTAAVIDCDLVDVDVAHHRIGARRGHDEIEERATERGIEGKTCGHGRCSYRSSTRERPQTRQAGRAARPASSFAARVVS